MIHHPNLWHFNRRSVSIGIAVGLFVACMPIPGQMVLALILAIGLRGNLALALLATWVSNPLTYAPLYYFGYKLGCSLTASPDTITTMDWSWSHIAGNLGAIYKPLFTGCLVMGISLACVAHTLIQIIWRIRIRIRWARRRKRPQKKITA